MSAYGVYERVRLLIVAVIAFCPAACAGETPLYLNTLKQRFDASDVVCTGVAIAPIRSGRTKYISGDDREELSATVRIESCFKGKAPTDRTIRVLGYSVMTRSKSEKGVVSSGPPTGFLYKGRNLLFLRRTADSKTFEIPVPIYQTAIRLADARPYYPTDGSAAGIKFALTREFEAALVQFDERDTYDIHWIFDLLGTEGAVTELRRFSQEVPLAVRRDISVALLRKGEVDREPEVIGLLLDENALAWKRQNAAWALGEKGNARAEKYLRAVAEQPATTDALQSLRLTAVEALQRLERRMREVQCQ